MCFVFFFINGFSVLQCTMSVRPLQRGCTCGATRSGCLPCNCPCGACYNTPLEKWSCCPCGCDCGVCHREITSLSQLTNVHGEGQSHDTGGLFCCKCSCFPSAARVNLDNGKLGAMSELQVGDKVQTGIPPFRLTYCLKMSNAPMCEEMIPNCWFHIYIKRKADGYQKHLTNKKKSAKYLK